MKRLLVCLLLVGVVGCGKSEQVAQQPSGESPQEVSPSSPQSNSNLTACPDCGGKVSKRAAACPHCGAPLKKMEPVDDTGAAAPDLDPEVLQKDKQKLKEVNPPLIKKDEGQTVADDGDHPVAQEKEKLVNVVGKDGKETSLRQKLITVKGPVTAIKKGPSESARTQCVTPYNIFYYLEPVFDKDEAAGFYRVGNAAGEQLGWLQKEDVVFWNTRCAIEPNRINAQDTFVVEKVVLEGKERTFAYDPAEIPGDATAYAFILGKPNGEIFPVAFCIARVDSASARSLPQAIITQPVLTGEARVVSKVSGNRVGQEVILVSEQELKRFVAVVGQRLERFTSRTTRGERVDVSGLLNTLKTTLASLIAGEEIKGGFHLEAIIAELPLTTETLRMTAADMAVMNSETFDSWLESLSRCTKLANRLLAEDKSRWISVSGLGSTTTRWTFFRLSDLP